MALRRAERILADLKAAGLVTIAQLRKRLPDGFWQGLAAVKAVSRHLFFLFGLDRRLTSKRLKQKAQQWARAGFCHEIIGDYSRPVHKERPRKAVQRDIVFFMLDSRFFMRYSVVYP